MNHEKEIKQLAAEIVTKTLAEQEISAGGWITNKLSNLTKIYGESDAQYIVDTAIAIAMNITGE